MTTMESDRSLERQVLGYIDSAECLGGIGYAEGGKVLVLWQKPLLGGGSVICGSSATRTPKSEFGDHQPKDQRKVACEAKEGQRIQTADIVV
ncbi:hypothetical protein OPV22_017111 [Ensete ventricosum]|uniref:Uncharacterized protein n=1 Tax=Ensete ventricosum TaxID=4639 RepID=A0AAV8PHF9_ENSVE|nr:hypothetical protein OPV22_017111 [Ensete ventricosum]